MVFIYCAPQVHESSTSHLIVFLLISALVSLISIRLTESVETGLVDSKVLSMVAAISPTKPATSLLLFRFRFARRPRQEGLHLFFGRTSGIRVDEEVCVVFLLPPAICGVADNGKTALPFGTLSGDRERETLLSKPASLFNTFKVLTISFSSSLS